MWSKCPCVTRIAAQRAPHRGERAADRRRVTARVDDDRLGAPPRRPDEVRVRPDRPELELVDGEASSSVAGYASLAGLRRFCCWRQTSESMK